jgi:DsbC/DsbD-like thiol-disulfide interchange protein
MNRRLPCLLLLAAFLPAPALAAHSEWTEADQSRLRLLLLPGQDGTVSGGIEIEIDPGWHTYWKNPGDTGVAPLFDFSGSENVASVAVRYPVPERAEDAGGTSLIYTDDVVLPLAVTPRDAAKPLTLKVSARFGICSEVCIPTAAEAAITLSDAPDPLSAARIAEFTGHLPKPPQPGRFDVTRVDAGPHTLTIDVLMPDSAYSDLFVEPPAGWYLGQPHFVARDNGVSRYTLSLAGRPQDADISGTTFRFVAVAGTEAIEKAVEIR